MLSRLNEVRKGERENAEGLHQLWINMKPLGPTNTASRSTRCFGSRNISAVPPLTQSNRKKNVLKSVHVNRRATKQQAATANLGNQLAQLFGMVLLDARKVQVHQSEGSPEDCFHLVGFQHLDVRSRSP